MGPRRHVVDRGEVLGILEAGLGAADPEAAVRDAVRRMPSSDANEIVLAAFGKAAYRMSRGAISELGERLRAGIAIVPRGYPSGELGRVKVREGTHPLPSAGNVEASRELVELVRGVGEDQVLLVLISGGGSSLLEVPKDGLRVEELAALSGELMRRGADIRELNAVRKHLSDVKGGQLLRGFRGRACVSLIVSDVVGNPIDSIASGPTAPDPSTYSDALDVLGRYGLLDEFPDEVAVLRSGAEGRLEETLKPGDPVFSSVRNEVILDNRAALRAMELEAARRGYRAEVLTDSMEGEAREVGKFLGSLSTREGGLAFCAGGETTVTVRGKGTGGRNQEIALAAALQVKRLGNAGRAGVGALATDGVDGNSPAAGAALGSSDIASLDERGARESLAENDSYTFLRRAGLTVEIGATGTNVNDLFVLLIRD
jgi:glycerate 2-kinase